MEPDDSQHLGSIEFKKWSNETNSTMKLNGVLICIKYEREPLLITTLLIQILNGCIPKMSTMTIYRVTR